MTIILVGAEVFHSHVW